MKLAITAIFKNEYQYVLEWLAYHLELGVDTFYIADNVSNDGTSQLLEALDELGIINRVYFPRIGEAGPQVPAYNFILDKFKKEVDLMAFIDADEFFITDKNKPIKETLKNFFYDQSQSALALNWRVMGSSGHIFQPKGLVVENYKHGSNDDYKNNYHIKTIVKPNKIKKMNIHDCILLDGSYVNINGENDIFPDGIDNHPKTKSVVLRGLYINHYVIKSRFSHFIDKANKGSAAGSKLRKKGVEYFKEHDKNDLILNDFSQDFLLRVKSRVARLEGEITENSNFMSLGIGSCDILGNVITGWVSVDLGKKAKVKIYINEEEFIIPCDRNRKDVFDNGLSSELRCGFYFEYNRSLVESDEIKAFIYSSIVGLKVNNQSIKSC